ncbi:hypothetical protein [Streptomyces kurssanovii]|uniref:HEAT repeat protein n=1 Tax=Streptomyces kurssanovii TaxID=67312 RepID=A0ABV3HVH4_9ACTN
MTTLELRPTRHCSPGERLLHGKGVVSAVGAGRAEDWADLDRDVWWATVSAVMGRSHHGRVRVGHHWFDKREIADWSRAPYWHEPASGVGSPAWSRPPTESEIALCLCHADTRVRAAALGLAESAALPVSVLPLVLIRCADTEKPVRDLARSVLGSVLAGADEAVLRPLIPLAVLVGMRRYGSWARDTLLERIGDVPVEAVAELLSSDGRDARIAGLRAGASSGRLSAAEARAIAEGDPDGGVRVQAVRAAMRLAFPPGPEPRTPPTQALTGHADAAWRRRSGAKVQSPGTARTGGGDRTEVPRQAPALDGMPSGQDARAWVLAFLDSCRDREVRRGTLAAALETDFFQAADLAHLAVSHRDRHIRRHSCAALLACSDGHSFLDLLCSARDSAVHAVAVGRLRSAGRGDEVGRHLTDPSASVRAVACREFRSAGGDPRTHYQELCADPRAVTPAAVVGLAEQRCPADAVLLQPLTRHPRAEVRARALAAVRMLGGLPDDAMPVFADDPDPRVRATALGALRHNPRTLRDLVHHRHSDVRATALSLLSRRHDLTWQEALPFLEDPVATVSDAAARALRRTAREIPTSLLLSLADPDRPRAQRATALSLIAGRHEPDSLLAALRLVDDSDPAVRRTARDRAVTVLRRREEITGPHADAIRTLADRYATELPVWLAQIRRRNAAERRR